MAREGFPDLLGRVAITLTSLFVYEYGTVVISTSLLLMIVNRLHLLSTAFNLRHFSICGPLFPIHFLSCTPILFPSIFFYYYYTHTCTNTHTHTHTHTHRSWSPHTLSVKDLHLINGTSSLRVLTCSTDRTVVMYDVHAGKQVRYLSLIMHFKSAPRFDKICDVKIYALFLT